MTCQQTYKKPCPAHSATPLQNHSGKPWPEVTSSGLMFFSMAYGHLTNCHIVLNFARWLAELLGKTVVVPVCADGDGCFQKLRWTNLTAIWQPSSFESCRSPPVRVTRERGLQFRSTLRNPSLATATCLGMSAEQCANEVSTDPKLSRSLVLNSYTHYVLPILAAASLNRECGSNGRCDWGALAVSERCHQFVASGGCEWFITTNQTSLKSLWKGLQASDLCPRACAEHAYQNVPEGNVYVANLFMLAMGLQDSWRLCNKTLLNELPRTQAVALRATLPRRFVCMHWRAGDFLRKRLSPNSANLSNITKLAIALRAAASAVGASEALVLSNADAKLAGLLAAELQGTLTLRMSRCTNTPADAEKTVCAGAAALLLSRRSTFSTHILKLAAPGTRYSVLGGCPTANASAWLACAGSVP